MRAYVMAIGLLRKGLKKPGRTSDRLHVMAALNPTTFLADSARRGEIPQIAGLPGADRAKLDAFTRTVEEIATHEDDRELRVFRAGWRPPEVE